jgi:superfamily II DNA or RNA helicase
MNGELVYSVETRDEAINRVTLGAARIATGESVMLHLTEIETRDYQIETWQAIDHARQQGASEALVQLATGLGKTTVAVIDTLRFIGDFIEKEGRMPKVLFACHRTEILDQAAERFAQFAPALTQGKYIGSEKSLVGDVTFATLQSMHNDIDDIASDQFDLRIFDEGHHAQATTFKRVVEHFDSGFQIAYTATPERMDEQRIEELFGEPVYTKSLAEAMDEGYLANVDYHIVFDDAVKRAMEAGFNPTTQKEIRDLLRNESRNEQIAAQILEERKKIGLEDAKTIVFCENIDQADEMAELLGGKAYHSGVNKEERKDTLAEFRASGVQLITTRDMFNEGLDIPDARLIVFLRSTSSRTIFEQQLGRGLRKHLGKDTVSVLDFVANIERLAHIRELRDEIKEVRQKRESSQDGPSSGGGAGGFNFRGEHASFEFDKLSVDLLTRMAELQAGRWAEIQSIEDIAELWEEVCGDVEPSRRTIIQASKAGIFMSVDTVNKFGGVNALRQVFGLEARGIQDHSDINSLDDVVGLWREQFGDTEPTIRNVNKASGEGLFMSTTTLKKFGGVIALKGALGFNADRHRQFASMDEVAALWQERFGDEVPSIERINEASRSKQFIGLDRIRKLGGLNSLKLSLGYDVTEAFSFEGLETVEDVAALWKEKFGNEKPTQGKIKRAAANGVFMSHATIHKRYGGMKQFHRALGFTEDTFADVQTLNAAAELWRDTIGEQKPTRRLLSELAKQGQFMSLERVKELGGLPALQKELGHTARSKTDTSIVSIEDVATLWRETFGDEAPTTDAIYEASRANRFMSYQNLSKYGGITALQAALGLKAFDPKKLKTMDDVAELWREVRGDTIPTTDNIHEAAQEGVFISVPTLSNRGGITKLREALGIEVIERIDTTTISSAEELAKIWKEKFGEEEPTYAKINAASREGLFPSDGIVKKFGGTKVLKKALLEMSSEED